MAIFTRVIIGLIATIHFYILWFEMFAWTSRGPEIFKSLPKEIFEPTSAIAANQGLYNGFLAIGLVWTYFITDRIWKKKISIFFLGCITLAGIYGTFTIETKILFIQTIPAIIAITFVLLSDKNVSPSDTENGSTS